MIKDLFSSWFGESKKATPKISDKLNSISFYIDEWSRPHIYVNIENTNEFAAEEFGKLLYLINSGKYEQNILDQIVELSNKKPFLKKAIQESLVSWASLVTKNIQDGDGDNTPYVRPTQVFK